MPASQGLWGPEWVRAACPAPTPRLRVRGRWELPAQCQKGMWGWRPGSLGWVCMRGTHTGVAALRGAFSSPVSGVGPGKQRPCYRKTKGDLPGGPKQPGEKGQPFPGLPTDHVALPFSRPGYRFAAGSKHQGHGCGPSCQWPASAPRGLLPQEHPGSHALLSLSLRALCSPGPKGKIHVFRKIQ